MKCIVLLALLSLFSVSVAQNCGTCELLVTGIESWLSNNATEAEIEANLQQLCALVPAFSTVCDQYIVAYLPQIINYLDQNYNPQQVCTYIGLCSSKAPVKIVNNKPTPLNKIKVHAQPKLKAGPFCTYCTAGVGIAEQWVLQNSTVAQIEAKLESYCALIPDYSALCDALITSETPQIVEWINQNENPQQICGQLGLC